MGNEKRIYNRLEIIFRDFIDKGIPRMKVDHTALGYKDARSAHRSLYYARKLLSLPIKVKWNKGNVLLIRTDRM